MKNTAVLNVTDNTTAVSSAAVKTTEVSSDASRHFFCSKCCFEKYLKLSRLKSSKRKFDEIAFI